MRVLELRSARRTLAPTALILALAGAARAEEIQLRDGTAVEGTVTATTEEALVVRLKDGSLQRVRLADVVKRVGTGTSPSAATLTATSGPAATAPPRERGVDALRAAARAAGVRSSASTLHVQRDGASYSLVGPRTVDLAVAPAQDETVDTVAGKLWGERGRTSAERAKALTSVAGLICWVEGEILATTRRGTEREATVGFASRVLTGTRKVGFTRDVRTGERLWLPVVLCVTRDEGARFLEAATSGDTVGTWPFEPVVLGAAAVSGPRPGTVSTGAAAVSLELRVKDWLNPRRNLRCTSCNGTRLIRCAKCDGAGKIVRGQIQADRPTERPCSQCNATGGHVCEACPNGTDEAHVRDLVARFGSAGRELASFFETGMTISVVPGRGETATGTATYYVRYRRGDEAVVETSQWIRDEKGVWRVASGPAGPVLATPPLVATPPSADPTVGTPGAKAEAPAEPRAPLDGDEAAEAYWGGARITPR